jgi:murein DD-endopeptidase MepM/ murein hydrolase activator NlpD
MDWWDRREKRIAALGSRPNSYECPSQAGPYCSPSLKTWPTLFHSLPVDPDQITSIQWYGNTEFAHGNQSLYTYGEGLHPGIDLGAPSGTSVQAGVYGMVVEVTAPPYKYFQPHSVRIQTVDGDYLILYGHLENPPLVAPGQSVKPETKIGEIGPTGNYHVHVEVRGPYGAGQPGSEEYIYNPLWLMSDDMILDLAAVSIPSFYEPAGRWLTPLSQPLIVRGSSRLRVP